MTTQLCQLSDVHTYLSITNTNSDALLTALITNASAIIESYCCRVFGVNPYTDTYNGNGLRKLYLANGPIQSVTTVTIDGYAIPPASTPLTGGYVFDSDILYLRPGTISGYGDCFNRGVQNVVVEYTAGFPSVPPDIAQACIELVASKYKASQRVDVKSEGLGPNQSTTYSIADMPASVKSAIRRYQRWPRRP